MEHITLSLVDLNFLVRKSIRSCLPDTYWVYAEISDVKVNYSGHCYLEFIQKSPKSDALIAKARGIIWKNTYDRLKASFEKSTGMSFTAGINVLVNVSVDFHELYGYSLTVLDIDPTYTLGDIARRRKEIINRLEQEGVLTLNKELILPELAQRIAVISSATAAGFGDFCNQLEHNTFGFRFFYRLFPAVMQGDKVESSIIEALNRINDERDEWDVVVIIRGGGATSDLSGFDTYELAENCAQFPLPIITGIGHERDDTVIDFVAHTRVKTPTATAEFLINHLHETAVRLEEFVLFFQKNVPMILAKEEEKLKQWQIRLPSKVQMCLQTETFRLERIVERLQQQWATRYVHESHRLELMLHQLNMNSPERLLEKGYSMTLKDGKIVTDASMLQVGDEVITKVAKGEFKSKVI